MPRPRVGRARVAVPNARPLRVASKASSITREEVQQKLADKVVGRVLTNSDDSDDLVVARKGLRNRRDIPRREIYGSGGVGKGDQPQQHKSPSAGKRAQTSRNQNRSPSTNAPSKGATSSPLTSLLRSTPPKSILKSPASSQPNSVAHGASVSKRPQTTPGVDRSFLAGLKPRPRQPSLLAGLKQDATNLEDTAFSISGLDEFDDILPNDESTPLHTNRAVKNGRLSSGSHAPSSIAGRKRKLSEAAQSHAPSEAILPTAGSPGSDSPALPTRPDLTSRRTRANGDVDDGINAPPQSSSPMRDPAPSPHRAQSPSTSPQKLKIMPTRKRAQVAPSKMTTEALQALLPSRRGQEKKFDRDVFDIVSDSGSNPTSRAVDEGVDEESYLPAKRRRRDASKKTGAKKATKKGRETKAKALAKDRSNAILKGPSPIKVTPLQDITTRAAAKTSQQQGQGKITYTSRRPTSYDDEKENLPDDVFDKPSSRREPNTPGPTHMKSENAILKTSERERKRWADIDAFDLAFEEVSSENIGGSSPR